MPPQEEIIECGVLEVVVQGLEAVAGELFGFFLGRLLLVQDRCVVELGEGVDEQLPVAVDRRAVAVDLGHLVERVAFEPLA